jgi:hypothetical protein
MLMVCAPRVSAQVPASSSEVEPVAPSTPGAATTEAVPPPAETQGPEPPPAPPPSPYPPPPLPPPRQARRYGDRGTAEVALGLGYSSLAGFLAAGGFRYFVLDGLAPGFEATYVHGGTSIASYGLALASLRVVPVRTPSFALALTARAGRVFLADHGDGWGAGGGAGVLIALGSGAGLEIGYEFLRLLPASFCADLSTCVLQGPVLGLRLSL